MVKIRARLLTTEYFDVLHQVDLLAAGVHFVNSADIQNGGSSIKIAVYNYLWTVTVRLHTLRRRTRAMVWPATKYLVVWWKSCNICSFAQAVQ